MKAETKAVLRSLGFSSFDSTVDIPKEVGKFTLRISRYGNRIFCRGGMAEYDLLRSHLPIQKRETEVLTVGSVPVLCVARESLFSALRSIAHFRVVTWGSNRTRKRHQLVTTKIAKRWMNAIPLETDLIGEQQATIEA